jgi:hypothetical protein
VSRIRVNIDHVALQGFDPAQRTALIEGLKNELTSSLANLAEHAAFKSKRAPVLRLGKFPLQPGLQGSRAFGASIAHAIGRSVKP